MCLCVYVCPCMYRARHTDNRQTRKTKILKSQFCNICNVTKLKIHGVQKSNEELKWNACGLEAFGSPVDAMGEDEIGLGNRDKYYGQQP